MGFLGLERAFETLGLKEVHAETLEANERSIRYHGRLGFESIPARKEPVSRQGRVQKVLSFRLTKENWLGNKQSLKEGISRS